VAAIHLTFARFDAKEDVSIGWVDEFATPPPPQRRFRALTPRALAAAAVSLRYAIRDKAS
jgi:hypothetical protein